jgi:hypothetical protein
VLAQPLSSTHVNQLTLVNRHCPFTIMQHVFSCWLMVVFAKRHNNLTPHARSCMARWERRRGAPSAGKLDLPRCTAASRTSAFGRFGRFCSMHTPLHRADWDSTLGFPGEGPRPTRLKATMLTVVTASVTSWQSGVRAIPQIAQQAQGTPLTCVQEHRLRQSHDIAAARKYLRLAGWASVFAPARTGPKGGNSGGTAIIWPCGLPVRRITSPDDDVVLVKLPAFLTDGTARTDFVLGSIYGLVGETQTTADRVRALAEEARKHTDDFCVAGDYNASSTDVLQYSGDDELRAWEHGPTCFPSNGSPSCFDYFICCRRGKQWIRSLTQYDTTRYTSGSRSWHLVDRPAASRCLAQGPQTNLRHA